MPQGLIQPEFQPSLMETTDFEVTKFQLTRIIVSVKESISNIALGFLLTIMFMVGELYITAKNCLKIYNSIDWSVPNESKVAHLYFLITSDENEAYSDDTKICN